MTQPLVLSLFPGLGLLDMAFELEGFCVVRGPDLLWGGHIETFHPPAGKFDGVIGGPPCQMFSQMRFIQPLAGQKHGNLIPEFERVVREAAPGWFLMENVRDAPVPVTPGFLSRNELIRDVWVAGGPMTPDERKALLTEAPQYGGTMPEPLTPDAAALDAALTAYAATLTAVYDEERALGPGDRTRAMKAALQAAYATDVGLAALHREREEFQSRLSRAQQGEVQRSEEIHRGYAERIAALQAENARLKTITEPQVHGHYAQHGHLFPKDGSACIICTLEAERDVLAQQVGELRGALQLIVDQARGTEFGGGALTLRRMVPSATIEAARTVLAATAPSAAGSVVPGP
jgi:hypothetical protein